MGRMEDLRNLLLSETQGLAVGKAVEKGLPALAERAVDDIEEQLIAGDFHRRMASRH